MSPNQTPRERRASERAGSSAARHERLPATRRRGSPILLITVLVGAVGIALVAGGVLIGGHAAAPGVAAATLNAPASPTPIELAAERTLGRATAPATLELWSDFQCPICGQFARTVEPALVSKYVTPGTLRIVHHDAAFQGAKSGATYDESVEAAAGARCAAAQGRYWPFQDWTFANQIGENQGAFSADRLSSIAIAAGVDLSTWRACVATGEQQRAARAETAQAVAGGVNATPTMRLNGTIIVGLRGVTEMSGMIEKAAAAAGG
jgi:protein-disulfide isomerase